MLTAAALLAGCGSRAVGAADGSSAHGSAGPCGALLTPAPASSAPGALARDGVRITAANGACADFEVTNGAAETSDFTILFSPLDRAGGVPGHLTQTVEAVAPGATVKGRLTLPSHGPAEPAVGPALAIAKVRSVPSAEAPKPDGACPASGLRVYADEGDAAMGLRVVGLHLRNCGAAPVALDGYPRLQLLDLDHRPVDGVELLSGGAAIASGTGADDPPRPFTLHPGDGARATLAWRNTTTTGTPVTAPYLRVRPTPDAAPVMVTPELDLGTTARLGVGAWIPEPAR